MHWLGKVSIPRFKHWEREPAPIVWFHAHIWSVVAWDNQIINQFVPYPVGLSWYNLPPRSPALRGHEFPSGPSPWWGPVNFDASGTPFRWRNFEQFQGRPTIAVRSTSWHNLHPPILPQAPTWQTLEPWRWDTSELLPPLWRKLLLQGWAMLPGFASCIFGKRRDCVVEFYISGCDDFQRSCVPVATRYRATIVCLQQCGGRTTLFLICHFDARWMKAFELIRRWEQIVWLGPGTVGTICFSSFVLARRNDSATCFTISDSAAAMDTTSASTILDPTTPWAMARTASPESAKRTRNIFPPPAVDGISPYPVVVNVTTAKYMISMIVRCSQQRTKMRWCWWVNTRRVPRSNPKGGICMGTRRQRNECHAFAIRYPSERLECETIRWAHVFFDQSSVLSLIFSWQNLYSFRLAYLYHNRQSLFLCWQRKLVSLS